MIGHTRGTVKSEQSTSRRLDWNVNNDRGYLKASARELQTKLHENLYNQFFQTPDEAQKYLTSHRTYWRNQVLSKFEIFKGSLIHGTVIEIGAGTAWCSALLSQKSAVEDIYALDYDPFCVDILMPQVFHLLGAEEKKITRVLGSFNYMYPAHNKFDLVVSIGGIHHSENLLITMKEIYQVLKPGGYFLATEPCEYNQFTIEEQKGKEETIDPHSLRKYGREVKQKDNSDHYYRLCEYETCAYWAGFTVWAYTFDEKGDSQWSTDDLFKYRKTYEGFEKIIAPPFFAKKAKQKFIFDRLMLIAQKPFNQ